MESEIQRLDVVCIANYTTANVLRNVRNVQGDPIDGNFFKPLPYRLGNVNGAILLLNSDPKDLQKPSGVKRARVQFMAGLDYLKDSGIKVGVLGAGLKRVFGEEMEDEVDIYGGRGPERQTIQAYYPNILFTNGDNGTAVVLLQEVDDILRRASVIPGHGKIVIVGAGLLGTETIKHLVAEGYRDSQIVIISSYSNDLKELLQGSNIAIYAGLDELDFDVDVLICCSHKNLITAEQIRDLGCSYVLDVSAPAAFPESEYLKCGNVCACSQKVYRQDAGNAYNAGLEYLFNPQHVDLSEHEIYGCFAEGTSLAHYLVNEGRNYAGKPLAERNYFVVSPEVKKMVSSFFSKVGFSKHPDPLCFGRPL